MRKVTPRLFRFFLLISLLVVTGCNLSPQRSVAPTEEVAGFVLPTPEPTVTPTPRPTPTPLPVEETCDAFVTFVTDVNFPDDTEVEPGSLIEKRWQVKNTGTCNWGPGYVWKLQEDSGIDVPETFDLFPARQGTTATISLTFIAPEAPGTYTVDYIPYGPDGLPIGQNIYVRFIVSETTE